MKLILHIGNHKTGTTTIQNSLIKMRKNLFDKYSFLYPDTFLIRGAHHYLPILLLEQDMLFGKKIDFSFDDLLNDFKKELTLKQPKVVFISSEEFFRFGLSDILKLKPLFTLFDEVEILSYLRTQPEHIESSYKFGILWEMVRSTESFESLVSNVLSSEYHNYYLRLKAWEQYDIYMNVKDFSEEIKKGFLASFYKNILNFDIEVTEEANNASLSRLSSLILRIFNSIEMDANERTQIIKILNNMDSSLVLKESLFNKEQYLRVIDKFKDSNALLREKYNISFKNIDNKIFSGEKFNTKDRSIINNLINKNKGSGIGNKLVLIQNLI